MPFWAELFILLVLKVSRRFPVSKFCSLLPSRHRYTAGSTPFFHSKFPPRELFVKNSRARVLGSRFFKTFSDSHCGQPPTLFPIAESVRDLSHFSLSRWFISTRTPA